MSANSKQNDLALFYAEWKVMGLLGLSNLSTEEIRIVDPEGLRRGLAAYHLDGTSYHSYAILGIQRPVIDRLWGGGDTIETMICYDYDTGTIYQQDSVSFSIPMSDFYFSNKESVYRIRYHESLDEAVKSAKSTHAEILHHYLNNTSRGKVSGVRVRAGAELVDNELIVANYERAVSVNKRLLGKSGRLPHAANGDSAV